MDAGHLEARGGPSVAGEGTIRTLAEAAVLGLPIDSWLRTKVPEERELYERIHEEAADVMDMLLTNLARKIVSEYAEARKRGKAKQG